MLVLRSMLGAVAAATALSLVPASGPVEAAPTPRRPDPLAGPRGAPRVGLDHRQGRRAQARLPQVHLLLRDHAARGHLGDRDLHQRPGLEHLAAGAFLDGYDPKTGTGSYKLCRVTTRHGRFKIEAKVSTDDGSGHITEGRLPADTFQLRRPRRHH